MGASGPVHRLAGLMAIQTSLILDSLVTRGKATFRSEHDTRRLQGLTMRRAITVTVGTGARSGSSARERGKTMRRTIDGGNLWVVMAIETGTVLALSAERGSCRLLPRRIPRLRLAGIQSQE